MAILALRKAGSHREPNLGCRGADRPGWCEVFPIKSLHEHCRMGRRIVMMKLICLLGHCECDGHTVHKFSQRHLTADWLAPRESDCSWMHCNVSSDWLPCYIKVTHPVLEIFKMAGYFPDSLRICWRLSFIHYCVSCMPCVYSQVLHCHSLVRPHCDLLGMVHWLCCFSGVLIACRMFYQWKCSWS